MLRGISKRQLELVHHCDNESTAGADASVEALKLYDMKLTLAQLSSAT